MSRSKVAEVTGKMPFSGKHTVKYWFQKGREASRNGEITGKLANAAALGGFALLHAVQLKMGISELTRDDNTNPALLGIDAVYTAANALATYTQAYLSTKVLFTRQGDSSGAAVAPDSITAPIPEIPEEKPGIELGIVTPTEIAVTLGGQALFLATYQW